VTESPQLLGAARLRELLNRHGIRPTKMLGQNFVIDPNTIRKVLAVAQVRPGDRVLEVGAGAGSLTLGLVDTGATVVAVEVDRRLVGVLEEVVAGVGEVEIVTADALEYDLAGSRATKLVANLPYNVAATVVLRALEEAASLRSLTVMTQREVGERLAAAPGSKTYGATSVMTAFYGRAGVAAPVSRNAFYPVPKVDSVIVRIDRHLKMPAVDATLFRQVVRAAFSQRRKMLRRSLVKTTGSLEAATEMLRHVGISAEARAEDVAIDEFVALVSAIQEQPRG